MHDRSGRQSGAQAGALGQTDLGLKLCSALIKCAMSFPEPRFPPPENGLNEAFP